MYQYQFGGKDGSKFQLTEASDLVVIRTKDPIELKNLPLSEQSKSLAQKLLPVNSFPEANVTVFKCVDKRQGKGGVAIKLRNQVRKNFKKEAAIRFAGRVLKDVKSGEPVIYTENFFIKFKDAVTESECTSVIQTAGLEIKVPLGFAKNAYFVKAPERTGLKVFDLAATLLVNKAVEYCHPELIRRKKYRGIYSQQWHLKSIEKNGQLIQEHIEVAGAWEISKGAGIRIAVIDDGVDQNHEEFTDKIIAPFDAILNMPDANPKRASENHGTACAGIACAAGKHKASGVAPEALLMPIRSGGLGSLSEAIAFRWATDNGADIISCSWGPMDGPWWDSEDFRHYIDFPLPDSSRLAIEYAIQNGREGKGCIITWAAGNGNESVDLDGYASYPKVIAVAASNDWGVKSYYSDYGKAVWCCFPSNDVDARYVPVHRQQPRTSGIWTTDRSGRSGDNPGTRRAGDAEGDYTNSFGGTSAACPGVAGVIALMLGANPNLTWQDVKMILKNSCDKIDAEFGDYDAAGHSPFYGYGRINATKAVDNALKTNDTAADYTINGIADFSKLEAVNIEEGSVQLLPPKGSRLLAFSLEINPFNPSLNIEYRSIINGRTPESWKTTGELSGTSDGRRKLIGIAIRLTGESAENYDVHYQVKLWKKETWLEAKNATICGSEKKGSRAIELIIVQIVRKN